MIEFSIFSNTYIKIYMLIVLGKLVAILMILNIEGHSNEHFIAVTQAI